MKVTVVGCGNAFSEINYNQSFLLEENGKRLLVDCGQQVLAAMRSAKIPIGSIDDIYISHLHADHVGSLEAFAFLRYDWASHPTSYTQFRNTRPVGLIGNKTLLKDLWDKSLRGGLESMEGFDATLETFFHVKPVEPNGVFIWEDWMVRLIQQIHIMTGSIITNSFGLFMTKEGHKSIYFTTDSQHCSPAQVEVFYKQADIIIQDCEVSPYFSNVHANYVQLAGHDDANSRKLSSDIKSKMFLSHYQDCVSNGLKPVSPVSPYSFYKGDKPGYIPIDWTDQIKKDGFAGIVKVGQSFEI